MTYIIHATYKSHASYISHISCIIDESDRTTTATSTLFSGMFPKFRAIFVNCSLKDSFSEMLYFCRKQRRQRKIKW